MPYVLRTVLGIGLIAAACTALAVGTYLMIGVGTCASGPTAYTIERECPDGSGTLVLTLFGALGVLGLGGAVHAHRGPPPGHDREPTPITLLLVWNGVFLGIAAAAFWGVWGPDADPGGATGAEGAATGAAIFVGVLFTLMGLGGLITLLTRAGGGGSSTTAARPLAQDFQTAATPRAPARPTSADPPRDPVAELERLVALRNDGTITDTEFDRLKGRVIDEGTAG